MQNINVRSEQELLVMPLKPSWIFLSHIEAQLVDIGPFVLFSSFQ